MAATIYPSNDTNPHRSHIPRLNIDAAMASTPTPAPSSPNHSNGNGAPPKPRDHGEETYRLLSHAEWVQFCRGVGVFSDEESEEVIRPTSRLWPPKGFRDGLYKDVLVEKTKFTYGYHWVAAVSWTLMLLQIAMSAVLTALGSVTSEAKTGTAITSIAAVNTCIGGILALLHNSGLPDRYRSDRNEFYKLEEHIKSIVDTALIPADQDINDAITGCFDMFRDARQTVQNNIPASYTTTPADSKAAAARISKMVEPKK